MSTQPNEILNDSEIDNAYEQKYFHIIARFLKRELGVDEFIDEYIIYCKSDINTVSLDERFRRIIDRLFTSCDRYSADPVRFPQLDASCE